MIAIPRLIPGSPYSLLYSIRSLRGLPPDARIDVALMQGGVLIANKTLHAGDPDWYTLFRVPASGEASVRVTAAQAAGDYQLQINRWPATDLVKSGGNHRWQDAMAIRLGTTVFAAGDDQEYIPLRGTPRRTLFADGSSLGASSTKGASQPGRGAEAEPPGGAGIDWYKFEFASPTPKLVFFEVELMERDQIPVNVSVYRAVNGALREYFEGEDPVGLPHEAQALPGNKFTPRVLADKGTYYVAVHAAHPEYKLRTREMDPPPYSDPRIAVRTALDYILSAGESWHANTPRRGAVLDRVAGVHQETSLCVGCHATHFPLRAQIYASRNGYPVEARQQLQFLAERVYNNPRPFYGFEEQGAVWSRVISAPANVLGRMAHLMDVYETEVSRARRPSYHEGVKKYLELYYAGRDKLPPDETNGNTPLVSAHEVAWYAWTVTKDPRMGSLIAKGEVKNLIDLCYQTLALADIDRQKYGSQIAANAERILSLQREDGQWSMRFDPKQPEAEFQTGHALWALHAAGIPAAEPHVAKSIAYLMGRQQAFGGWMDPLQSFENFRTPFRETQMAVLALSSYFPLAGRTKGWNSPPIARLADDPVTLLGQLDQIWDAPPPGVLRQIEAAAGSPEVLIRQAAIEALGRLGLREELYAKALGDPSKLVQRTAAWAMRQSYSSQTERQSSMLVAALASPDDRVRWGATRVFAAHFSVLAKRPELAVALAKLTGDPSETVRMNAVKGLWQFWFWTPEAGTKGLIEDALLAAIGKPQTEWVRSNLREAIYNVADENIRYLYNNWVPLLAKPEDRERAIQGRLAVESRLAGKFAHVLEAGPDLQKRELLRSLTELDLRRGDVYDAEADLGKTAPPIYNRIGNDTEQITFF
ncbi:MAG: HEAT repeat domain-containing protein, partial [Bryobacteraceae bacterium]